MFDYKIYRDSYYQNSSSLISERIYKSIKEKPSTSITVWLRRLITIPENPSKFFIKI